MAPNDIYDSKTKYERFLTHLSELTKPVGERTGALIRQRSKYVLRNPENLTWFLKLAQVLASRDTSYIRRLRLMRTLKIVTHATAKPLEVCDRDDINQIITFSHDACHSSKTKIDFIRDLKFLWRQLFPELDAKDRPDETLTPYAVRHLTARVDRSRDRRREDKSSPQEIQRLIASFSSDRRMQAYVALQYESLARPQELLYRRIRDVEVFQHYARIEISDHGKEGTGVLQCIDSYPYLAVWLNEHPLRHQPDAFLFCNLGNPNRYGQMRPHTVNKHIRAKLELLGINKPITSYSLKRNGVTHRRLRGDSDLAIQHAARWTSTKQLQTYDQSDTNDAFSLELSKRGLTAEHTSASRVPRSEPCIFCQTINGATETICRVCKRPLDKTKLAADAEVEETGRREREQMKTELVDLRKRFAEIAKRLDQGLDQPASSRFPFDSNADTPFPGTAKTT